VVALDLDSLATRAGHPRELIPPRVRGRICSRSITR
jgi:hypothetical protein